MEGTPGYHRLTDILETFLSKLCVLQAMDSGRKESWDLFIPPTTACPGQLVLWQLYINTNPESQLLDCGHLPMCGYPLMESSIERHDTLFESCFPSDLGIIGPSLLQLQDCHLCPLQHPALSINPGVTEFLVRLGNTLTLSFSSGSSKWLTCQFLYGRGFCMDEN